MNKSFFNSLLVGFGATLAVLVAVAMPPGGWGVAVGVILGLLATVPLLIVLVVLLNRERARHPGMSGYAEERPIRQSVRYTPNYQYQNYAQAHQLEEEQNYVSQAYAYPQDLQEYSYYPQGYLNRTQPQSIPNGQEARRVRVTDWPIQQTRLPHSQSQYYSEVYRPEGQTQPEIYYGNEPHHAQPALETNCYEDYSWNPGQIERGYYPTWTGSEKYRQRQEEVDHYYSGKAESAASEKINSHPAPKRTRRTANQTRLDAGIIEAEYRTIGEF